MSTAEDLQAKEEVDGSTASQQEQLREAAKWDLFFLCKGVLGYDQLRLETHGPLCTYMVYEDRQFRLILMPRGHLKSTICTMGDSNRLALIDPNIRILIASANETKAASFLEETKNHWTKPNALLPVLFPELVPPKFAGPGSDWSSTRASLNRTSAAKEATWNIVGAGASGTSQHYNRIKPDDLIGEEHKQSRAAMERVKIWNRSIEELLDNQNVDKIDWIGTRKTVDDVYQDIMDMYGEELSVFLREPIEDGKVIFPLKFSLEKFQRMMTTKPEEWYHDYMNNPVGKGGTDWPESLIQYFVFNERGDGVFFQDPVTKVHRRWRLSELDIVLTCDPNSGKKFAPDKAAICAHGYSPENQIFMLESRSERWSPSELVDELYNTAVRWKPRVVGIEEAGQITTEHYFKKKCDEEKNYFATASIPHKNVEKEVRIRKSLDGPLKSRRFFVLPGQSTLITQIKLHPQLAVHNWDEIDAASMGAVLYKEGRAMEDQEEQEVVVGRIMAARGVTGYGRSWKRA